MADVLGAVEHSVGQSRQKVPRAQVPGHGPHREARSFYRGNRKSQVSINATGLDGPSRASYYF